MDITLGLDFGTHQSKLCLSYRPYNETVHEFIEFDMPDGSRTTLLPSIIQINNDETISIGYVDKDRCMASRSAKPEIPIFPKEPNCDYPTEPIKKYPPKPEKIELDWKDKLQAIKGGGDPNDVRLKKWQQTCEAIDRKWAKDHNAWVTRCREIDEEHEIWESQVNDLQNDYNHNLKVWESEAGILQYYRYFKIASFSTAFTWNPNHIVSADVLSIWYLAYVMLTVKRHVKIHLNEIFEESVAIQMGVPTSANSRLSDQIKNHACKLLVAARRLVDLFDSPEDFCNTNYKELMAAIDLPTKGAKSLAEDYGMSVLPEAFAGLQSLTNRKRLSRGKMHLLVDIGGGTTDIAFFTITEDLTPNIHIVKSFHKGLNFVFEQFCKENPQFSIIEAQELFWDDPHEFRRYTSMYTEELNKQLNEVIEIVKREFMYKVGKYGKKMSALTFAMNGCPTVYCGGGSTFHRMRISPRYFSDVRMVGKDTLSIPNLKNRTIPNELYTILATSYGLSVPQIEDPQMIDLDKLFEQIGLNYSEGKQKQIPRMDYGLLDD